MLLVNNHNLSPDGRFNYSIAPQYVAGVKLLLVKQAACIKLATVRTMQGDMTWSVGCTVRETVLWFVGLVASVL